MKSASHEAGISLLGKLNYSYKLYKMRISGAEDSLIPWDEMEEYESFLNEFDSFSRGRLTDHKVLEIGYGARPWRLISMNSLGVDIKGIDLDQPTYGFSLKRLWDVLKKNGPERFVKTFIRSVFFDRTDIESIRKELALHNRNLVIDKKRMKVGNAADSVHFSDGEFSFCYSEDVLEHIPADVLPAVLDNLKKWLSKDSIILLRPNIYTGISGGHDPDFYAHKVLRGEIPVTKAWAHLTDPGFKVNTFLNKLRMRDYVRLFSERFEILAIRHKYPELGKEYLTDRVFAQLKSEYSTEELMANQVLFVLRVK